MKSVARTRNKAKVRAERRLDVVKNKRASRIADHSGTFIGDFFLSLIEAILEFLVAILSD